MELENGRRRARGPSFGARRAIVVAITIPVAALLTIFIAAGAILPPTGVVAGRESRAAVAIRDDVTPFQKWVTRAFTYGQLTANYDHVEYLTQESDDPKHSAFVTALEAALERYDAVDLFLLAHTNRYIDWVSEIDPDLRHRIRLVYNSGCQGTSQADDWLDTGAGVYVGHPGESESEIFYVYFLRRWLRGSSVHNALEASNRDTHAFLILSRRLLFAGRPLDELWTETRAAVVGEDDTTVAREANR